MNIFKSMIALAAVVVLTGCADNTYMEYKTAAPQRSADYDYLNDYGDLKTYVDRATYPTFKLGGATNAAEFNNLGLVYALDVANFDELVTGNAFKYSSIVKDDGTMDFSTVQKFITNATDAGLSVYGHTLLWHSQQTIKYLNGLIADRIPQGSAGNEYVFKYQFENGTLLNGWGNGSTKEIVTSGSHDGSAYMKVVNPTVANPWSAQLAVDIASPLEATKTYTLHFWAKASAEGSITAGFQNPSNYAGCGDFPVINLTTDWKEYTLEATVTGANAARFLYSIGKFAGEIDFDGIELYSAAAATVELPKAVVLYNFNDGTPLGGWGNSSTRTVVDGSRDGSKMLKFTNPSKVNFWEAQIAVDFAEPLEQGKVYYLRFWGKASAAGTVGAGYQNPSNYNGCGNYPNFDLTTDWKLYDLATSITGDNAKRLTFNLGAFAGDIYFDDVEIYHMVQSNTIPLTAEEKRDTLTWELERWIKGMMGAVNGKVKAWDLCNEPMSDGHPTELKSAAVEGGDNNFYWQDYLGKDYVRTAVKFARQYGGNDLVLFVNDYNLEASYNNNAKCDGLINMITYWESDGVTKIDGIGTQMHVSCSMNPEQQKRNEDAVVKMFQKLAATGKLIRVSELDMGLQDADGNAVKTIDVTEEQHHAMAAYYKFIVEKYLSLIPVAKQYGITAWGVTDSPETSFWRAGEPIGLWDINYYRKHTYAGFADGLAGK